MKKNESLYDLFLSYSYDEIKDKFKEAKTKDEQDFYMALANLILQRAQRKVIKE